MCSRKKFVSYFCCCCSSSSNENNPSEFNNVSSSDKLDESIDTCDQNAQTSIRKGGHDFAINCQQKRNNLCIFPDESKGASDIPGQKNKRRPLIPDEVMTSHMRDLDYAHKLTQFTLTCESCGDRHLIDQQVRRMGRDYL